MSDEYISSMQEWERDAYTGDDIPATAPLYMLIKVDVDPQIVLSCNPGDYEEHLCRICAVGVAPLDLDPRYVARWHCLVGHNGP